MKYEMDQLISNGLTKEVFEQFVSTHTLSESMSQYNTTKKGIHYLYNYFQTSKEVRHKSRGVWESRDLQNRLEKFKEDYDLDQFIGDYRSIGRNKLLSKYEITGSFLYKLLEYYNIPVNSGQSLYEVRKSTLKDNYGVDNIYQLDYVKDKIKQHFIDNYGVENPGQIQSVKDKIQNTFYEKYGGHPFTNDEVKDRCKKTKLEKHGDENYNNIEKQKETCVAKYGTTSYLATDACKQAFINKYGVARYSQTDEFNSKCRCLYKYDNVNFDSQDELVYYIWNKHIGNDIIRHPYRIQYISDGKIHYYKPDFLVNGKLVEVKGKHLILPSGDIIEHVSVGVTQKTINKQKCMVQNNVQIITKDDMLEAFKYVKENFDIQSFRIQKVKEDEDEQFRGSTEED